MSKPEVTVAVKGLMKKPWDQLEGRQDYFDAARI